MMLCTHESRVGNCLESSGQDPQCRESRKVSGGGLAHQQGSPHEDVERQVCGWWAALHDEVGGNGPEKPAKVEYAGKPRIFIPFELEIVLDAEDGRI